MTSKAGRLWLSLRGAVGILRRVWRIEDVCAPDTACVHALGDRLTLAEISIVGFLCRWHVW